MKHISAIAKLLACSFAIALLLSAAPVWAGNILDVVETGGDNEPTDTIPAQWTGQSFTVSVANEPVPGAVVGDTYTVGAFGDLSPAFVDRNHRYTNTDAGTELFPIPAYLLGGEYIMSGNDNRDNASYRLDVTVANPSRAFMLIDNRLPDGVNTTPPQFGASAMQWILDEGWAAMATGSNRAGDALLPDEVGLDEGADGGINQYYSVYYKDFPAGTFSLFQADNAGRNMYGVVVVPEPSSILLLTAAGLMMAGIMRRRRS